MTITCEACHIQFPGHTGSNWHPECGNYTFVPATEN